MSEADLKLIELAETLTDLEQDDICILLEVSHSLPFIANLEGGDTYIDILTKDSYLAVVAQYRHPEYDLYKRCIVGELMNREDEPGVYRALALGIPSRGLKATIIADERIPVRHYVSPILNKKEKIIGVLAVERDIQEDGFAENGSFKERYPDEAGYSEKEFQNIAEYMNDAVSLFDAQGICVYANIQAKQLFARMGYKDKLEGLDFDNMTVVRCQFDSLAQNRKVEYNEVKTAQYHFIVTYSTIWRGDMFDGVVMTIKDTTELHNKETELVLKSKAINEIHHRVKNNLQMIISLIGLDARRSDSGQVKEFARDIIGRIQSISLAHDILSHNGVDSIELKEMLDSLLKAVVPVGIKPGVEVIGDKICLQSSIATVIALVVNELVVNCVKHAFTDKQQGHVVVSVKTGEIYSSITVADDGVGFVQNESSSSESQGRSQGLGLVKVLVESRLKGVLKITDLDPGTKVYFSFRNTIE